MYNLPEAVTLGRLLNYLELEPTLELELLDKSSLSSLDQSPLPSLDESLSLKELLALPLQSIHLGEKSLHLPLEGMTLSIQPQNELCYLTISTSKASNEKKEPVIGSLKLKYLESWEKLWLKTQEWADREQGRIFAQLEKFLRELAELVTHGYGLTILTELKKILDIDLFLLDKHYKVLAWEGGEKLPTTPIAIVTPKLSNFPSLELKMETPLCPGRWNGDDYKDIPLSWYPLAGHQGVLGYLGITLSPGDLGQVEKLYLYKTAVLLYCELARVQSIEDTERQHYRDFLFDLLYNNFDSLEVIQTRGKLWGMDLTKPHLVVVGEIASPVPETVDPIRFQELMHTVSSVLRGQPEAIFLERNEQIVLLYPLEKMIPLSQWQATAKQLLNPLLQVLQNGDEQEQILFGVGNLYSSPRFIHRSFQEAKYALELGQLFRLQKQVTLFQDLGVMRLLLKLEQQELEDFRNELLSPLLKFDRENTLNLEETLLAYFASDGDLNRAGDQLFLHPNTLRYRLKKAAEVLERDLGSLETQINLYIALKIGRLMGQGDSSMSQVKP